VVLLVRLRGLRYVSERDGGQAAALNAGFARTQGDVIGWLNSDDAYAPGALAAVGAFFAAHPDVEWIFGRCPMIDRAGLPTRGWITRYKEFWARRYTYRRLLLENFISQPAVFFRRRLLERVGGLDPALQYAMDYHLWLRMGRVARPRFVDRVLAYFRVSGENKTSTGFHRGFREDLEAARRVAAGRYPLTLVAKELNLYKLLFAYEVLARWPARRGPA
jgi:glycosyltransferase involved in cell wall biosynthesis